MKNQLTVLRSGRLETESCWSDIPEDVWSLVLSKLFLRDRSSFKLVCKLWNLTIPIPPALPPPVDSPYFDSPCLMLSQWSSSSSSWKIFHSLYNVFYYMDFPELTDAEIHFSKDGWLLMSRDKSPLFFFNPFTKAKFELPPTANSFISVCFTSPPTSSDCFVFGIFVCDLEFGLLRFGDDEWETGWIDNYKNHFWQTNSPPLFHNGVYYWLEYKKRNVRIYDTTKGDTSRWINFSKCEKEEEEDEEEDDDDDDDDDEEVATEDDDEDEEEVIDHSYMLVVEGDISAVFVCNNGRRVSVEKLDLSEMCWRKLESLGDKCLYVSTFGSFAETRADSGLANTIYFNKFYGKSGVIYSLSSGMYQAVVGNFANKEAFGLTQLEHGAWIKPTL